MKPKLVDIHSHVHFAAYDSDRDEVMKRSLEEGVWMINVGTQRDTSESSIALSERYGEGVFATIGLHPIHTEKSYHDTKEIGEGGEAFTSRGETFDPSFYEKLALHEKVVAIGECGLDYYRLGEDSTALQKEVFVSQIELANKVGKPLMLHIRNAYRDAHELLKMHAKVRGNVHFFAGTWEEARWFLDLGFTLSFTGVITFTNQYDEVVRNTPLDVLMTETDAPYIAPIPLRGKRNEPRHVAYVAKRIAEIKGLPLEEVEEAVVSNARRVFSL